MLDFPSSPSVGQKYPASPVNGVPTYTWDGEKWGVTHNSPPGTLNPLMDGAVAVGTSEAFSREDHRHPTDTSRAAASDVMLKAGNQTITGGFNVAPVALSAGSFQVNALLGNYQYIANNGVFTITAPANDCSVDVLVTNGISAGGITFTGFTIGANTGDLLTAGNGHRFIISFRRINAISTYVIKALQ